MRTLRRLGLGVAILLVPALACDGPEPLAPEDPLFASNRRTVAAPSNVTTTAVAANQLEIVWRDNSDSESGFEVFVAVTAQGVFNLWSTKPANDTTQTFMGVSAEQTYCAKVRAFTARGRSRTYSAFSDSSCASTALPPLAPQPVFVAPRHSSAVDIWWQDRSTNEDGFRVERSLDQSATWTVVATTGPSPLGGITQGGLVSEQEVCYRVIAFNGHGESAPTSDCTTPPAAPTALTATGSAAPAIDLTWTDNSAVEDGSEVLRSTSEFSGFTVIAVLTPNSVGYRDAAVSANVLYWYTVRARKDGGSSSQSNTVRGVAATAPPGAPYAVDVLPWGSTAVSVYWFQNTVNTEGFRVERSADGGTTWVAAGTTQGTSFGDTGRVPEQSVCYRVVAFNGVGESSPSSTDCTVPPAAPTNLVVQEIAGGSVEYSWTDNSAVEDGYEVWLYYYDPYCGYEYCDAVFTSYGLPPDTTTFVVTGVVVFEITIVATRDGGRSDPLTAYWY